MAKEGCLFVCVCLFVCLFVLFVIDVCLFVCLSVVVVVTYIPCDVLLPAPAATCVLGPRGQLWHLRITSGFGGAGERATSDRRQQVWNAIPLFHRSWRSSCCLCWNNNNNNNNKTTTKQQQQQQQLTSYTKRCISHHSNRRGRRNA